MKIVELKESQKDIDLLQLMVDVTEQKILPASEKLLAQAKEFGRRGEKYAAQQWRVCSTSCARTPPARS